MLDVVVVAGLPLPPVWRPGPDGKLRATVGTLTLESSGDVGARWWSLQQIVSPGGAVRVIVEGVRAREMAASLRALYRRVAEQSTALDDLMRVESQWSNPDAARAALSGAIERARARLERPTL